MIFEHLKKDTLQEDNKKFARFDENTVAFIGVICILKEEL